MHSKGVEGEARRRRGALGEYWTVQRQQIMPTEGGDNRLILDARQC